MSADKWEKFNLAGITEIIGGGTPRTTVKEYWNGSIPWISVVDFVGDKKYIFRTEKSITQLGLVNSSTRILKKGQIIISARGTVGELAILGKDMAFNQSCYGLSSKAMTSNEFLYYLLKYNIEQIRRKTNGAVFDTITRETFDHIEINLPPLPTQHRIAEILSALDDKIELNRQTNATLEAIAQTIFKEWFVNFNFPSATGEMVESELGMIPEGWRVVQLGEVSDLSWGDTKTTKNSYSSEGYIAYSASGPDGYLPYYDFSRDGIVVSAIGAYSGKTWFAHGYWSCIKNTIRFWSTDDNLSNEYLYLYTSPKGFWPLRGSAQPFISQTDAREKRIIYPGNHLARYFGEVLQPLFQLIRRNDDEAFTLSQTRDSLLPKLMNGEIEV